jgi:ribosomal protein S12 methylthiotransferase
MVKVSIISLGCPRNQLDSEVIAGSLKREGFVITSQADSSDICIINTCAFINSAREESVDKILEAAALKKSGKIKHLVISGCLSQLYKNKLADELNEADLIVGTSDFPKLPSLLRNIGKNKTRSIISDDPDYLYDETSPRIASTPSHYAYVKISEGCSNFCSYCIISRLRGKFRSRKMESIVTEIKHLTKSGKLKEVNLIGQDTTMFGIDRYGKIMFSELLRRICSLSKAPEWIRILYTHPAHYTNELISVVADEQRICKYLDLPIQHISDTILKRMNRQVTKKDIVSLIKKLRKNIPGLTLRTSVIVGFPGETDRNFKELLEFLRETRFERLGAFIYSKEPGTRASHLDKQVSESLKQERFDILMKEQQAISMEINKSRLGKIVDVLIDEKIDGEKSKFIGRTKADAVEIDGVVYVSGKDIKVGDIYKVRITDTLEYDLAGEKI